MKHDEFKEWNEYLDYDGTDSSSNHHIHKQINKLKGELKKVIGNNIQLIIPGVLQVESNTKVTGILLSVDDNIIKLQLNSKVVSSKVNRIGIYRLAEVIGFIQAEDEVKEKKPLQIELEKVIGQKIQLITASRPPAGRPPNITGILKEVDNDIVKLRLQQEKEGSTKEKERIGIYQLENIIGFVPVQGEGCSDSEKGYPLSTELKKLVGKKIEVYLEGTTPSESTVTVTGILLESQDGYIKMETDSVGENGKPKIVVYQTSQIKGFAEVGTPGGGTDPGKVKIQVTVEWPEGVNHPGESKVILIREDVETIVQTVGKIAVFISDPAGTVIIEGEDIPGFITPIKEIKLPGKEKFVLETLTYIAANIPVQGVSLNQSAANLIVGETVKLISSVLPPNANNQAVNWETSDNRIASVEEGLVTAKAEGNAIITVTTDEGAKTAIAKIMVVSITQIVNPAPMTALLNELVILPLTVTVALSDGNVKALSIVWKTELGEEVGLTFRVPEQNAEDTYTFIGYVSGTDLTATLVINVDKSDQPAVSVTGITLDVNSASIFVGDTIILKANVMPESATNKAVIWTSSEENIAGVIDGMLTAIAPGLTVITAETVDGGYNAYCQVSVSAVPEIELIYPTQTVYDTPQEVTINVANLVAYKQINTATNYNVKVEQSGANRLLGEGIVTLYPETVEFNLYNITHFETTTNYSSEYFVYMSTDQTYPKEDEMTAKTNFKIGSAVPTIPKENIIVGLEIVGGSLDSQPGNIIFLLARELDKDAAETTWRDYATNPDAPDSEKEFTDEVKLKGKTDQNGLVIWEEPGEPLKLGGYLLLEVTPTGYIDNLNLVNPDSDGELFKEVHLTRDGTVKRSIVNTYIG